ncbi:biopolymer transporter ExbD [Sandarakinorhabdus cyanobacteriorum]|uniref:Biopolymer transporter ExbD n=2 Tax=Sandarakinorhabdus cyanobacteriorum TaxID=1981098 RepID=A0A255Z075_9SPHN|nr:biopolymer transporter ExbD [Sandarakinorhabdus cyanobacteriorum]OYQ34060.1 biopolymer transporter ExbD [Sandarakinorhabdus cyanobacteriorum]
MSVGNDSGGDDAPMNEINTTPLVDVMLVLLIIFLITVPVVIQTVPLTLPTVTNLPTTTKPENVLISVDGNCDTYWGQTKVDTKQELLDRGVDALKKEIARQEALGAKVELPEVHIRGDKDVAYRCIGGVVFTMQRAGFLKVGFISEPTPGNVTRDF